MSTSNISELLRTASAEDTAALRSRLAGEVLVEGDDEYEEARRVPNLRFEQKPAVVVRARGAADVAEAVKFARAHDYELAVRSGGHSLAGHSSRDGSLVIDLSQMNAVTIDRQRKVALVQAGATSADLAGPAHAYGLSVSTGDTGGVGLGGLITGGGIGLMVRKHGLTIDNLLSAEVVTAEGDVLRATAKENADLFWAIRGGGGNFGIVTEFELKLWSNGSVYGGTLVLPATPEVVAGYVRYALGAPDELTTIAHIAKAPKLPFIPADRVGETVLMVTVCYAGSPRQGTRAVQPLRRLAAPIGESLSGMPYPVMFQAGPPAGVRVFSAVRGGFARELTAGEIAAAIEAVREAQVPLAKIQLRPLGGAMARVDNSATAFAHRDKDLLVSVIGAALTREEDGGPCDSWTAGTWSALQPAVSGAFASFVGNEGAGRIREAYPGATFAKLACVKAKYDPENVFHLNQNIKPGNSTASAAA